MGILKLLFWGIAYTAGVVRLASAVLLLVRERRALDGKKTIFLFVFLIVVISLSNLEILLALNSPVSQVAGLLAVCGAAFITASLPLYIHEALALRHKRLLDGIFVTLGAIAMGVTTVNAAFFPARLFSGVLFLGVIVVMAAAIVYSMVIALLFPGHTKASVPEKLLSLIVIAMIPIMVFVDFLWKRGRGFIILPLLYCVINVLMILTEYPELVASLTRRTAISAGRMRVFGLTEREQEVAERLIRGRTYQAIADEFFISIQTVKTHVNRIYAKTDARNKMDLLAKISQNGTWGR